MRPPFEIGNLLLKMLTVAVMILMLNGPALSASNETKDATANAQTATAIAQETERQAWNSGNLIFIKRLEDGTYTPTTFSLLLLVMVAIFILKRRGRKKK